MQNNEYLRRKPEEKDDSRIHIVSAEARCKSRYNR